MKSQAEEILEWLKAGHRLTALEAVTRFGCLRVAARIHDLRCAGYPIASEMETTRSGKRIAVYRLGTQ